MMKTSFAILTVSVLAGALAFGAAAARAGGVVTYPASITGTYDVQNLDYIAAKGGMLTEIIGNPFDVPKAEVDEMVNRILEVSHPGQRFPFFSQAPADFPSPYRVVVVLNQGTAHSGHRLCGESYLFSSGENRAAPSGQGPGTVEIAAAYCAREVFISSVSGRATGIQSLQSETFRKLVSQIGRDLFPRLRLDRNGSGDSFF